MTLFSACLIIIIIFLGSVWAWSDLETMVIETVQKSFESKELVKPFPDIFAQFMSATPKKAGLCYSYFHIDKHTQAQIKKSLFAC